MYEKFGQFINGKWQQSSDKSSYEVINPANEEILGKASKATPDDVSLALKSAEKGFLIWKKFSPWDRAGIIRRELGVDVINKEGTIEDYKTFFKEHFFSKIFIYFCIYKRKGSLCKNI